MASNIVPNDQSAIWKSNVVFLGSFFGFSKSLCLQNMFQLYCDWIGFSGLEIRGKKKSNFVPKGSSRPHNCEAGHSRRRQHENGCKCRKNENHSCKLCCEVIYEMFHILNCEFWGQVSYDHRSCERNLSNCPRESGLQRGLNQWPRDTGATVWPTELWNHWAMKPLSVARPRFQTPLKSWLFQASICNCLNCFHSLLKLSCVAF